MDLCDLVTWLFDEIEAQIGEVKNLEKELFV